MVEAVLDLEEEFNQLIVDFEREHKVALTTLSLNREDQTEEYIGVPVVKAVFMVPYTMER